MYAFGRDMKKVEQNRAEFREHLQAAKAALAACRKLSTVQGEATLASIEADVNGYSALFEQISGLVGRGKVLPALAIAREAAGQIGARMEKMSHEYIDMQKEQLVQSEASAAAETVSARWISLLFVAIGLAGVGLIAMVVRRITGQLLTITASLSDGTLQIAAGSNHVAQASQTLAQGASEQASSLEETSASAEEITSMTRQNAVNTSQVAQLMTTVDQRVTEGNNTLGLMIVSMKQINASSDKISENHQGDR